MSGTQTDHVSAGTQHDVGDEKPFMTPTSARGFIEKIVIGVSPKGLPKPDGERDCILTQRSAGPNGKLVGQDIRLDGTFGPFLITFELDNLDWHAEEPFWIKQGGCPSSSHVDKKQIWVGDAKAKSVTIMDMNVDQPCKLKYRMNFSDGTWCDPVIENGGGNNF